MTCWKGLGPKEGKPSQRKVFTQGFNIFILYCFWVSTELIVLTVLTALKANDYVSAIYGQEREWKDWNLSFAWGVWASDLVHVTGAGLWAFGAKHDNVTHVQCGLAIAWVSFLTELPLLGVALKDFATWVNMSSFFFWSWYALLGLWHLLVTVVMIVSTVSVVAYVKDSRKTPDPSGNPPTDHASNRRRHRRRRRHRHPRQHMQDPEQQADQSEDHLHTTLEAYSLAKK